MENVYQKVALFYEKRGALKPLIKQNEVEKYLRKLAWQGKDESDLREVWGALSVLLNYVMESHLFSFSALTPYDYQEVLYRLREAQLSMRFDEKTVPAVFDIYEAFLIAYGDEKSNAVTALKKARDSFYKDGEFYMPERPQIDSVYEKLSHEEEITLEEEDEINDELAALIDRMQHYYQQTIFTRDFSRARAMYVGPYGDASLENEGDFIYGFWDYFFFDYHMLAEDITPVRYFFEHEKDVLSSGEKYILQDLMKTKLTVFYVNRAVDDCIFCTDLFSEKQMMLPIPDNGYTDFKNLILYGHLYPEGIMLLNYVTAVQASSHLRKRIREEVLHQFDVFKKFQKPDAELQDFFIRHAVTVRHTINILSNFAQLKVMPNEPAKMLLRPEADEELLRPELDEIDEAGKYFGVSCYATELAKRLYVDYVAVTGKRERRGHKALPAAVLIMIQSVNGMDYRPADVIIERLQTSPQAVINMIEKIGAAVRIEELDPRYRTEEGFVQMLYLL